MEQAANKVPGVAKAVVNYMTLKMSVEFEDGCDVQVVMENVLKVCRKVEPDCEIYF